MALLAQNDSGSVTGANSYSTATEFKAYHNDRGNAISSYSTGDVEKALIKATDYMDGRWTFLGTRLTRDQSTEFPRRDLIDTQGYHVTGIPDNVKEACNEYALIELEGDLDPSPMRDDRGQIVQRKTEKVGPLTESTEYAQGAGYDPPDYPVADRKLADLVEPPGWAQRG